MKKLLQKLCVWFLTRHNEYCVTKASSHAELNIPTFIRQRKAPIAPLDWAEEAE